MANKTIGALTLASSAAANDWLEIETAAGASRKIAKSSLMGGAMTGGGSVITNGFALTVPASGTAALINVAQTFTAKPTFGAGISFGQTTLDWHQQASWAPQVADAITGGNVAIATNIGTYNRTGNLVTLFCSITNISTVGVTAGNTVHVRNLPFPCITFTGYVSVGAAHASRWTFTHYIVANIINGTSYITFPKLLSGSSPETPLLFSDIALSTFTDIFFTISYLTT